MWRPETTREKAARENPQVTMTVTPPPPRTMPQAENPIKSGSFCDTLLKGVQYIVCCCGCCTSWDTYYGHTDIDWNTPQ